MKIGRTILIDFEVTIFDKIWKRDLPAEYYPVTSKIEFRPDEALRGATTWIFSKRFSRGRCLRNGRRSPTGRFPFT